MTTGTSERRDHDTVERIRRQLFGPSAVVTDIAEVLLAPHDVPLFLYVAEGPAPIPHSGCPPGDPVRGAGCGLTRSAALASTLGEMIERYSGTRCCPGEARRATRRELGPEAVGPEAFVLYADHQYDRPEFHFVRAGEDDVSAWVAARSLTDGAIRHVPAYFVYQGMCANDGRCVFHTVSTGLACSTSPDAAMLSALCEVVERDAIMIAWLGGLELPRVLPPPGDEVCQELYARIHRAHLKATVLDATTDLQIPVRIAVVENESGVPLECAVGMAAHFDPVQAHRKALIEAGHTRNYLHQLARRRPALNQDLDTVPITRFEDHVFLYGHAQAASRLDCWRRGPWRSEAQDRCLFERPDTPAAGVRSLSEHLRRRGFDVLAVDVTLPEIEEVGLCVYRVIVPGLVPLTVGRDACLGGHRLERAITRMGLPASYLGPTWNPHPHPFP